MQGVQSHALACSGGSNEGASIAEFRRDRWGAALELGRAYASDPAGLLWDLRDSAQLDTSGPSASSVTW